MPDDAPNTTTGLHLREVWTRVLERTQSEVAKAADGGRALLRAGVLQRDADALRTRLGKQAFRLWQEGELSHPGLDKTAQRIAELDDEISRLRSLDEPGDANVDTP